MNLISLHRKYSFTDFQNQVCSIAALVTLCIILISIALPFLWIFKINDDKFSPSADTIAFEQPMVKFQYKYMFLAENAMDGKVVLCSSFHFLNNREGTDDCAKVSIIEKDENFDGLTDEIHFTFDFHTMFHYGVKSVSLAMFLDARLEKCKFHVPSAVVIKKKSFINNMVDRKITISGSLQPAQKHALQCPFFMRNVKSHFFYETLNENQTDIDQFNKGKIIGNLERNPIHFNFREDSTDFELDPEKTSIKIKLKIPELPIRYKKSFWQACNDVWINYIAIIVISFAVANLMLNYLFENRWLIFRKKYCLKNKEM